MASGDTTTVSLTDSLDSVRSSARIVREQEGGVQQLVRKETLGEGIGLSWLEVKLEKLTASRVAETTHLDNPQEMQDSLLTVTPTVTGIHIFLTDRVAARVNKKAYAKIGGLAQNAIERLKDEDGITVVQSGATTASPGSSAPLTAGAVAAAKVNISSNTTDPGKPPYRAVFHGFQIKDIFDELIAGVGTYAIPEGMTARVFTTGFNMPIAGVEVYENGNISTSGNAATGGVFAQEGIIIVQGRAPRTVAVRKEDVGGGGTAVYHYDEYAYGLGNSTRWVQSLTTDATAPTS